MCEFLSSCRTTTLPQLNLIPRIILFELPTHRSLSFHRKEDPPSHDNRTVAPYVSYPAIVSDNHAKNTKEKTPSES
ncbi:hypothetical protein M8J76_006758 [Diaphorina citri]|nr:hypothetical protein M8J76_006758 [Diaphorina citri]